MAFHYTRTSPLQHAMPLVLLGGVFALGALPAVQDAWARMVVGTPDLVLLTLGPWLLHALTFWTVAPAFHWVDRHDRPAWLVRHRIQRGDRRQPPMGRTLRVLALNHLVFAPLMLLGMALLLQARGWSASAALPAWWVLLAELVVLAISAQIVFYAAHRFLHRPWWMRRVHRVHHEYRNTNAFASEYAHPFEFCLGNFGPLAIGVVLFAPSLPAIYLFTVLAILQILVHHSGYAIPWASWSVPHAWHHERYDELFGATGAIDRLLGTAPEFATFEDGEVR